MKKNVAALQEIAKACASAGKLASSTAKDYSDQYQYLTRVIENYAKKVADIDSIEGQLDGDAKGIRRRKPS